ncbi:MAG: thioesterase [Deltaproteobacteria bacterium]|nr:thioesterase [Deltaproteobacteria bacterium]TLN00600.1 MAG: thioesterase [bacterium]
MGQYTTLFQATEALRGFLEVTFHNKIPITRAMGIRVLRYDGTNLVLGAPLEPNVNDKGTAFGGSLYSLLVLAGWGLIHLKLKEEGINGEIMIHESTVSYSEPLTSDWQAHCRLPEAAGYTHFLEKLHSKGRARLALEAQIMSGPQVAVSFRGSYAVVCKQF